MDINILKKTNNEIVFLIDCLEILSVMEEKIKMAETNTATRMTIVTSISTSEKALLSLMKSCNKFFCEFFPFICSEQFDMDFI